MANDPKSGILELTGKESLFVGEEHGNTASANILKELSPQFKTQNVKFMFLEQFYQDSQDIIDQFSKNKKREPLLKYLTDNGWAKGDATEQQNAYMNALIDLIDESKKNGIKVIGIDDRNHSAPNQRHLANTSWAQYIQSLTKDGEKFVILAGNAHSADYQMNKGVDALLKIPSVDLNDQKSVLSPDPNQKQNSFISAPDSKRSTYIMTAP